MVPADDSAAPVGSATVQIHAPADALWDLITDIGRTGEWSPESAGGVWLDGARGPAVGARFRGTNRRGRVTWSTTCEVVAADRGREYSFVTGSAARPETLWRYRSSPTGPERASRSRSSWSSRSAGWRGWSSASRSASPTGRRICRTTCARASPTSSASPRADRVVPCCWRSLRSSRPS